MLDGQAAMWIENGEERQVRARLGFTYRHGYELELIEPREGTDFYSRDLHPEGEIFLHHLGFLVSDVDRETARLTSRGVPLAVRGRVQSGPMRGNFSYLDTRPEFGVFTELICVRLMGVQTRTPPWLARFLAKRQVKSGKRAMSM
jgi:hypothetical protein